LFQLFCQIGRSAREGMPDQLMLIARCSGIKNWNGFDKVEK
jgi:hypothetical protein